jgi:hypothetical protein
MSTSRLPTTLKSVSRGHGHDGSSRSTPAHPQDLSKLKRATSEEAGGRNELAWLLVLDNLVYAGEAETRWLDQVETRLSREATRAPGARTRDTAGSPDDRSTERAPR